MGRGICRFAGDCWRSRRWDSDQIWRVDITALTRGVSNDRENGNGNQNDQSRNNAAISTEQSQTTPAATKSPATEAIVDLKGTWSGTYGPYSQPARLIIKSQIGKKFDGVLEQGTVTVAFSGSLDASAVKMKQSRVLKGGESSWALGEDVGTLSANGKKMSGTGKDPIGGVVGMSYEWNFSRP